MVSKGLRVWLAVSGGVDYFTVSPSLASRSAQSGNRKLRNNVRLQMWVSSKDASQLQYFFCLLVHHLLLYPFRSLFPSLLCYFYFFSHQSFCPYAANANHRLQQTARCIQP